MNRFRVKILRIEEVISFILRFGVLFCGFFLTIGWLLSLFLEDLYNWSELKKKELEIFPISQELSGLFEGIVRFDPNALMNLGLIALIGLPMIRVAATICMFVRIRDYIFTVLATWVLIVLVFSYWCH